MAVHVEDFGVSASLGGTGDACRRGLSELHWTEQRSDRHEVRLPVTGAGDVIGEVILYLLMGLLRLLPVTKRFIHRYTSRTAQAPPGPAETNAEINAVLTPWQTQPMHDLIVRISLRERGPTRTDVTLSGSNLAGRWGLSPLRAAMAELRHAIAREAGMSVGARLPGSEDAGLPKDL